MPSYLEKTIRRHARLFAAALLAGGVGAALFWTWGGAGTPPDPFTQTYTDAELAEQIERGAAVFAEQNCVECHATAPTSGPSEAADAGAGVGLKGPPLVGIVGETVTLESGRIVSRDHRYLRRAIRDSRADIVKGFAFQIMPDYRHLDDVDVTALLLYIRSLGEGDASGATAED